MIRSLALLCALSLFATPVAPALAAPAAAASATPGEDLSWSMPTAPEMPLSISPEAANWKTAVIGDCEPYMPPAPPAFRSAGYKAEMNEILDWQKRRSEDDLKAIRYWGEVPIPTRWSEEIRAEIITASMVPPRAARALAVVHAAMYDAMVVTWRAKARYKRPLPMQENPYLKAVAGEPGIPSYPSEHAAISMAAAVAIAEIFPDHKDEILKKAHIVGETRIAAGAAHRSDVDAGFKIGEAVAKAVLASRAHDGTEKPNPVLNKQPGKWWVPAPMETGAGSWDTWLMQSGHQFRLKYDMSTSPQDAAVRKSFDEVAKIHDKLTPHQIERAIYWNFDVPALLWNDIARRSVTTGRAPAKPDSMGIMWSDIARSASQKQGLDTPHTARMLNVLHLTLSDAFVACWDTKYANLIPRPFMAALPGHPLATVVPTPPHPSWPSGHATASAAAAVVLAKYFPGQSKYFMAQAEEAAMSRLWGGIHFRKDNDDGLKLGTRIGQYCEKQAEAKGWYK